MSTTVSTLRRSSAATQSRTAVQQAATRLYDAEVALHHARQTHVDEWISAASERLHTAVEAYLAAVTAQVA